ncbi:MAG: tetratricopeptide repeat protein [Micromonosporaceae bacterium]
MLGEVEPRHEIEKLAAATIQARQRAGSGDLSIARTVLEAALSSGELRLGHDHPELVPLLVDLAGVAQEVGDIDEARQRLSRAYAIMIAAAGPEHSTALMIEERLSSLSHRVGQPLEPTWPAAASPWAPPGSPPEPPPRVGRHAAPEPEAPPPAEPAPEPDPPMPLEPTETHGYTPSPASPGVYDRHIDSEEVDLSLATDEGTQIAVTPVPAGTLPVPRPSTHDGDQRRPPGRLVSFATAVIMGAAALFIGTSAAFRGLVDQTDPPKEPGPAPTVAPTTSAAPSIDPPSQVSLTDNQGSVTLTWHDPTGGTAPFIVAGGRFGAAVTALQAVPAGRTRSIIYGLNDQHDYCFTVTAIYSTNVVASSIEVCTHRLSTVNGATGSPTEESTPMIGGALGAGATSKGWGWTTRGATTQNLPRRTRVAAASSPSPRSSACSSRPR